MAANKFATMVHTNTNKITLIIVYALLEWTLIFLILLNSLFSFLIVKFSQFFALKPPCMWCSTFHRFLEPKNMNSHRDLLCELHSKEVSILGFCPNHKKLAEIKDFCVECFSSHLDFQSEVKEGEEEEDDEQNLKCSCCGSMFHKKSVDDFILARNTSDVLEYTDNGGLIMELERNLGSIDQVVSGLIEENVEIQSRKEKHVKNDGKDASDSNTFEIETELNKLEKRKDSTSDFPPQDLEFFFDYCGNQLVPIELVDSTTEGSQHISEADEDHAFGDYVKAQVNQKHQKTLLQSLELETGNSLVLYERNSEIISEKPAILQETQPLFIEELHENAVETEKCDPDTPLVQEEAEVVTGKEITVLDSCPVNELLPNSQDSNSKTENGVESKNILMIEPKESGAEESIVVTGTEITVIDSCPINELLPNSQESHLKAENGVESKNILMIEPKEAGAEESFDTVDKLKSALQALYAELEEERGASAIAASETMAMINRLQEEKAAMQMEALQYQRMMEEQSESDQEALQLLNDLMVKREKELEFYRKKVAEYESKEGRVSQGSENSGTGSESEDRNGIAIDGNQESSSPDVCDDGFRDLETSLEDFEDERMAVFEQIKVLEAKLFALSDEDLDEENEEVNENKLEIVSLSENGFHSDVIGVEREDKLVTTSDGFHSDVIGVESEDKLVTTSNGFHSGELENVNIGKRRRDLEEEMDQVYGRLQALEADREFLKHCIESLRKGDKGMELLQEILQHLRGLRTMDLQ